MSGDVIFVLQGEEISMPRRIIETGSPYLSRILQGSPTEPDLRVLLPDWMARRPLMLYLEYLTSKTVPKVDLHTAQRLLWVADFLFDEVLQNALLYDLIEPGLTCETVVTFLQDAHTKLQKNNQSVHWRTLYKFCVAFVAEHAETVFRDQFETLVKFPSELLEELITVSSEVLRHSCDSDSTNLVRALMHLRGCDSVLQLLACEEQRVTTIETWTEPVYTWSLVGISLDNYLQESPSFEFAGLTWRLKAWSFAHEPKLAIALAAAGHHLSRLPKYSLLSLSCAIKASFDDHPPAQLITVTIDGRAQTVLRCLTGLNEGQLKRVTLQLYASPCLLHSCVLDYVCRHPRECLAGAELKKVSEKMMVLLLTHKRLGVETEDEVVEIIGKWCQEKYGKEMNDEVEICKILETVRWDYVYLQGLFRTIRNYPSLKNSKCFREILQRVVEQRIEPRKSYKQTARKEVFQSQSDFLHYLSTLVLDLEYNPKSIAVIPIQEATTTLEELKQAIKTREHEIRTLEDSLQALENAARNPQSMNSSPISPIMDLVEAEQRVTIPVPKGPGRVSKGPVSVAKPPIFKMKGDDLPDDGHPHDPPSP